MVSDCTAKPLRKIQVSDCTVKALRKIQNWSISAFFLMKPKKGRFLAFLRFREKIHHDCFGGCSKGYYFECDDSESVKQK